jgi:SAM-dependent methyltransferase
MSVIRGMGGAPVADYFQYLVMRAVKSRRNRQFRAQYPNVALPPSYLVYESFQMDYAKYYLGGIDTAKWIAEHLRPYLKPIEQRILDWGCGPARVIRHLPQILGVEHSYFGCDYNPATIEWCQKHIPEVSFSLNGLKPPLPYEPAFFDAAYGISIFTHLSEENHTQWSRELSRILRVQGVLLLTTHGEAFKEKLTTAERITFDNGKLVIRSKAKEGQRMFGAFHPPDYLNTLFTNSGFEILSHIPGKKRESYIEQDTWILRKVN